MDIRQVLDWIIEIGGALAAKTDSAIDDELIRALTAIRESEALLNWIESLWLSELPPGVMPQTLPPEEVVLELGREGLGARDIMQLISLIQQAIAILKIFWGK